jgi:ribosome maturation factor RimP
MFKEKVQTLLEEALSEREDLFLIDFSINKEYKITVTIDGDHGVVLQDCMDVSRAIEHNLDREEIDFSLEVASAGATAPLSLSRQYKKNIGRKLNVILAEEEIEATLTDATDAGIKLQWKAREPKPIGKGKVTVEKVKEIAYNDIVEAKVMITF